MHIGKLEMTLLPKSGRACMKMALRWGILLLVALSGGSCMISMPGHSFTGPLPPLQDEQAVTRDNLRKHVAKLATEIGERNIPRYPQLEASVAYITDVFSNLGYTVSYQPYSVNDVIVKNIEVELGGNTLPGETIVVGGHYDSSVGTPGANDNASGTAAVLELARLLKNSHLARKVRLVAFVNEEPPYFTTPTMGSRVYAKRARERNEKITAMLSLETIGYYSDEPGSQQYPAPFKYLYPDTGNFIGVVGNVSSRSLIRRCIRTFREKAMFPSEGAAIPSFVPGVDWSDHASFWTEGYPAIMFTDTAPFRYFLYHTPADTPEKLNYDHMARVVHGIKCVIEELAGAEK